MLIERHDARTLMPELSLQLYTLRDALEQDLDGALARVAGLGFRNVEAFDFVRRAPELAAALQRAGLASPTAHAPLVTEVLNFGGQSIPAPSNDEVFAAAAELGVQIVIDPMVGPERWASADEVRKTAELFNQAAGRAAEHGLLVGYHNHSQEFHHSFDGVTAYELFVSELEGAVALELDAYWAAVGKQDVAALAARLGGRLKAVHVKDGAIESDPFLTGNFDPAALGQVAAGTGSVPLTAVLDAAPAIEYAVVEYDAYEGDVFEGIAATAAFLAERGVR
jgi:sugar phosphate isomerase/epimerase